MWVNRLQLYRSYNNIPNLNPDSNPTDPTSPRRVKDCRHFGF